MLKKKKEMSVRQIDILILVLVVLAILSLNNPMIDNFLEEILSGKQEVFVERIIDGDTIESEGGSIRLLGINTPERGEFLYDEAKAFLESQVFNKTVRLEFTRERYDKYNRTLAYVFLDDKNVNAELVENGFANYYFYDGRDKYSDELEEAWDECINDNVNLCEKSANICAQCVNIITSDFLINNCNFPCNIINWTIKGEGREKFVFNQTLNHGERAKFELDLTDTGGSLFLQDDEGKLVEWRK